MQFDLAYTSKIYWFYSLAMAELYLISIHLLYIINILLLYCDSYSLFETPPGALHWWPQRRTWQSCGLTLAVETSC